MQDASVWETVFAILLPIGVALVAAVIIPAIIIAIALHVQDKRDAANPPTGTGADERAAGADGDASDSAADNGSPSADNAAPPAIPPSSVPTLNELAAGSEIPPRADHEDREGPGDDGARTDAAKIDAPTVVLSNPLPPAPPTVAQAAEGPADAWTAVKEIDAPEPQPVEESGTQLLFLPIDAQPAVPPEDVWIMPPAPADITTVDHGTRAGVDALGPGATAVMPERRPVDVREASTAGPAFALDTLECNGLTLAFASIRGLGHEDFGRPRQDYAAIAQEGRYLIAAMAECDSLSIDQLIRAALSGAEEIAQYLEGTSYAGGADALRESPSAFERWCDNRMIETLRSQKYETFSVGPLLGYLVARQNEIRTVRIILTGKQNGFTDEAIRERIREMYV